MKSGLLKRISKGDWHGTLLPLTARVHDAIRILNKVSLKIVLVVDQKEKLVGTVSDGDIRRGLLRGYDLRTPLAKIYRRTPLVVNANHARHAVVQLMLANEVQQIPIVDRNRRVIGLHLWDQLSKVPTRNNLMVLMAGGEGKRLYPFTADRPKPLVEVGGKPILEHILLKAKEEGFSRFAIAIRHLGGMIEDYIGNGKRWGIQVFYLKEKTSLGTAGAIRLLAPIPRDPILVTNGDVLADFNYGDLLDFHVRNGGEATMAVRAHEWQNPYGVVETQGLEITGLREKPLVRTLINAGVYVLNPGACRMVPRLSRCDMPELFAKMKSTGHRILAYPLHEPWLDVGRPEDLASARALSRSKEKRK